MWLIVLERRPSSLQWGSRTSRRDVVVPAKFRPGIEYIRRFDLVPSRAYIRIQQCHRRKPLPAAAPAAAPARSLLESTKEHQIARALQMFHREIPGPAPGRRRCALGRGSFCLSMAAFAGFSLPPWPTTLQLRAPHHSASTPVATRALNPSASPYWLLVTFAGTNTPQNLSSFATSSFNGVAVQIDSAYYTGQSPALAALKPQFAQLHAAAQRDIWPWVFVNRMVNSSGMDLSPAGVAQSHFLSDWSAALTVAHAMQSPGIVLDLEFYNDPSVAYAMSRFAESLGLSAQDAAQLLQGVGKTLADIAQKTYPTASIWILNSGLNTAHDQQIDGQYYYQPRGEISIGLLQELAALRSHVTTIDGGEDSLGYCHANLSALQNQIGVRQQQYAPTLSQYGTSLSLAGTITVWTAASNKTSWLTQGDCGMSEVWGIAGFTDYFSVLDTNYHYNWLYGAQAGGYDPSNATTASQLTAALRQAAIDAQNSVTASSTAPVAAPNPAGPNPAAANSTAPSMPLRRAHRGTLQSSERVALASQNAAEPRWRAAQNAEHATEAAR